MPRSQAPRRRRRGHQWTDFEIQTAISLICKGAHVPRKSDPEHFAKLLNDALNPTCVNFHQHDIDPRDINDLLDRILKEKKAAVNLADRNAPARLTRTKRMAFARDIDFTGSMQEWQDDGRRDAVMAQDPADRRRKTLQRIDVPVYAPDNHSETESPERFWTPVERRNPSPPLFVSQPAPSLHPFALAVGARGEEVRGSPEVHYHYRHWQQQEQEQLFRQRQQEQEENQEEILGDEYRRIHSNPRAVSTVPEPVVSASVAATTEASTGPTGGFSLPPFREVVGGISMAGGGQAGVGFHASSEGPLPAGQYHLPNPVVGPGWAGAFGAHQPASSYQQTQLGLAIPHTGIGFSEGLASGTYNDSPVGPSQGGPIPRPIAEPYPTGYPSMAGQHHVRHDYHGQRHGQPHSSYPGHRVLQDRIGEDRVLPTALAASGSPPMHHEANYAGNFQGSHPGEERQSSFQSSNLRNMDMMPPVTFYEEHYDGATPTHDSRGEHGNGGDWAPAFVDPRSEYHREEWVPGDWVHTGYNGGPVYQRSSRADFNGHHVRGRRPENDLGQLGLEPDRVLASPAQLDQLNVHDAAHDAAARTPGQATETDAVVASNNNNNMHAQCVYYDTVSMASSTVEGGSYYALTSSHTTLAAAVTPEHHHQSNHHHHYHVRASSHGGGSDEQSSRSYVEVVQQPAPVRASTVPARYYPGQTVLGEYTNNGYQQERAGGCCYAGGSRVEEIVDEEDEEEEEEGEGEQESGSGGEGPAYDRAGFLLSEATLQEGRTCGDRDGDEELISENWEQVDECRQLKQQLGRDPQREVEMEGEHKLS